MILLQRIKKIKKSRNGWGLKTRHAWNATGEQLIKAEISNKTYHKALLFSYTRRPARLEQGIQANAQVIELLAPMEELLTVAINNTANTLF